MRIYFDGSGYARCIRSSKRVRWEIDEDVIQRSEKLRRKRNRFPDHFPLDFRGTGSIAVHVDGPAWVAHPPGAERRACGGASIAKGDADPED